MMQLSYEAFKQIVAHFPDLQEHVVGGFSPKKSPNSESSPGQGKTRFQAAIQACVLSNRIGPSRTEEEEMSTGADSESSKPAHVDVTSDSRISHMDCARRPSSNDPDGRRRSSSRRSLHSALLQAQIQMSGTSGLVKQRNFLNPKSPSGGTAAGTSSRRNSPAYRADGPMKRLSFGSVVLRACYAGDRRRVGQGSSRIEPAGDAAGGSSAVEAEASDAGPPVTIRVGRPRVPQE